MWHYNSNDATQVTLNTFSDSCSLQTILPNPVVGFTCTFGVNIVLGAPHLAGFLVIGKSNLPCTCACAAWEFGLRRFLDSIHGRKERRGAANDETSIVRRLLFGLRSVGQPKGPFPASLPSWALMIGPFTHNQHCQSLLCLSNLRF